MFDNREMINFPIPSFYNLDNLDVLYGVNDETIDLIATDPPFNKKNIRLKKHGTYNDRWRWEDLINSNSHNWYPVKRSWLEQIRSINIESYEIIKIAEKIQDSDTAAFLCFLTIRLLEMHRVLKLSGSFYLHCDHTINSYIRIILDAIFGKSNFRNEIIWKRAQGAKNNTNRFYVEHDTILYYVKSLGNHTWNPQYIPLTQKIIDEWYIYKDKSGRRYAVGSLTSQGEAGYEYEFLGEIRNWRYKEERMNQLLESNRIVHWSIDSVSNRKVAGLIRYLDESKGAMLGDIWQDIKLLGRNSIESIGSPDQKPLELYERIILASSNKDDIVLDPFAGSCTTAIASAKYDRKWIAIDSREQIDVIITRLLNNGINVGEQKITQEKLFPELRQNCELLIEPPTRTD